MSEDTARLPIESQLRVLHANVTVEVVKARNLPRGAIFAPRAQVNVYCPFVEQPIATTEPSSRHTAPHWNFQKSIKVRHHVSALPTLKFVVSDSGAPDTPLGAASISIRAPATRAWLPLDVDSSRADLFVVIRWPSCPIPYIPPIPRDTLPTSAGAGPELRSVDPRPGAIFRNGTFVVEVTAAGIPASVAQPWLCVRSTDQKLRGGETPESRAWWKRKCQLELLKSADKTNSANDVPPLESATPSASCDSVTDSLYASDGQTAAAVDLEISAVNLDIPHEDSIDTTDTTHLDDDDVSTNYKPIDPLEHTSKWNALRQRAKDSLHDGKLEHAGSLMKQGVKTVKSAKNKASTSLDTMQNLKPTRSTIGATVTAAKIRRGKSKKRGDSVSKASVPSASPPQTTTPASVLQTLMAPRPRRAVDFGSFSFAEFAIEAPQCLYISITDNDSRLPDALGGVLEAELPLDILGPDGISVVLGYCEAGPVRAKASVWVRVTRIRDPNVYPAPVRIVTEKFMSLLDESEKLAARFKQDYPDAEGMTYLFVGGLFTNHYPLYFTRNVDYLQQKLLLPRVQCIPIHTESGIAANAKVIAASVAKTATRRNSIVLIGHSKGGCDILHAITHHIEIIPFIHGVISFQAPFLGTYAIDVLKRTMLADAIGSAIETLWHGQRESLLDMSYATRKASLYMFGGGKDANESVQGTNAMALRAIPIICVASHASFEIQSIRSAANAAGVASMSPIAAEITKNTGFYNDGLVVPADALIPFSDAIYLNDMMHTEPSLYVPGTKYPPGELTAAVLALLFDKAKRNESDANK